MTAPIAEEPPSPHGSLTFPGTSSRRTPRQARAHPDGIVDLSIGTPVDSTPEVVQQALREATDSPGYPVTIGLPETRQACIDWLSRRFGITGLGLDGVLPSIGSKELIAGLPTPSRARARRPRGVPEAGLPDLRGGRGARRAPRSSPPTR